MHLADINIWLALAFEVHGHHERARRWFDQIPPQSCVMCRFVQHGFVRLASNPAVFGDEAVLLPGAWELYDKPLADDRVIYLAEPLGLEQAWRRHTATHTYSHKVWADAYLAAFADAAGIRMASFDKGFAKFDVARSTIPE